MENMLQTVITQLPNLGVAVWMLWQQNQTIKSLLDSQTKLVDRLLNYVDKDKVAVLHAAGQSSTGNGVRYEKP